MCHRNIICCLTCFYFNQHGYKTVHVELLSIDPWLSQIRFKVSAIHIPEEHEELHQRCWSVYRSPNKWMRPRACFSCCVRASPPECSLYKSGWLFQHHSISLRLACHLNVIVFSPFFPSIYVLQTLLKKGTFTERRKQTLVISFRAMARFQAWPRGLLLLLWWWLTSSTLVKGSGLHSPSLQLSKPTSNQLDKESSKHIVGEVHIALFQEVNRK